MAPVKMFGQSEMRLPRVGPQAAKRLNGGVGEIQTLTGMIERSHVELIMRVGKLIIAKGKRRIALESLFEEPHCLEQIVTRIKNRLINQISGA